MAQFYFATHKQPKEVRLVTLNRDDSHFNFEFFLKIAEKKLDIAIDRNQQKIAYYVVKNSANCWINDVDDLKMMKPEIIIYFKQSTQKKANSKAKYLPLKNIHHKTFVNRVQMTKYKIDKQFFWCGLCGSKIPSFWRFDKNGNITTLNWIYWPKHFGSFNVKNVPEHHKLFKYVEFCRFILSIHILYSCRLIY